MKFCVNTLTQYMSVNVTLPSQEHFLSAQHVQVQDNLICQLVTRKIVSGQSCINLVHAVRHEGVGRACDQRLRTGCSEMVEEQYLVVMAC